MESTDSPRRAAIRPILVLLAVFAWWWSTATDDHSLRPLEGKSVHLDGVVERGPEPDFEGGRRLQVRASTVDTEPRRMVVRVRPSPVDATVGLDRLAAGDRFRVWARIPAVSAEDSIGRVPSPSVKNARLFEDVETGTPGVVRFLDRLRARARDRLTAAIPDDRTRSLAAAMLLGERAEIPPELRSALQRSGLAHLAAISGLHVGLIACWLQGLFRRAGRRASVTVAMTLGALAGFAIFVGPRPSVLRATMTAAGAVLGRWIGREGEAINGLFVVAATLAIAEPEFFVDVGFQLSFLAVGGILTLSRELAPRFRSLRTVATPLAVSLAAFLSTAPVVAGKFGRIAPFGILVNLVAVPLAALVLLTGYGTLLFGDLPWIGESISFCCRMSCQGLVSISEWASMLPGGSRVVASPGGGWVTAYYGVLLVLGLRGLSPAVVVVLGHLLIVLFLGPVPGGSGRMEVGLIDVGQGQAVAIHGPMGRILVVDAGGSANPRYDPGGQEVIPYLLERGARRVDVLVLTHDHLDHAGGARALVDELEIGELWLPPGSRSSRRFVALADRARSRGTAVVMAEAGRFGSPTGGPVRVVWPARESSELEINERSLVLLVGSPPCRVLIPGDLELAGEQTLLQTGTEIEAEALIVSHHGSRNATQPEWLRRVDPDWALISVGRANPFGHPHAELLDRLDRNDGRGRQVIRSDLSGTVRLIAGDEGWRLEHADRYRHETEDENHHQR